MRSCAPLLLLACLTPLAALHLESPPLLLDNAPLQVAWTRPAATFEAILTDDTGQRRETPRLPAAPNRWAPGPLSPGAWLVKVVLRDEAGEVLEEATWPVISWRVPPAPAGLAERWSRPPTQPSRLLVAAESGFRACRPGLPGLLAVALERWLGGEVKLVEPPPSPAPELPRLSDWLGRTTGDLLLLDLNPWCAGLPPSVAAARAVALVEAARIRGLAVVALAPRTVATSTELRQALLAGFAIEARLGDAALCLNTPLALLAPPFTGLEAAALQLPARFGPDGALTHGGHLRLMQALCRQLEGSQAVGGRAVREGSSLRLRLANQEAAEAQVDLSFVQPAGRAWEQGIGLVLPAGGTREVVRELGAEPLGQELLGLLAVQPADQLRPLRVPVRAAALGIAAVGGRWLSRLPEVPVRVHSGLPDPLTGAAGAGAGQPKVPFRLPAGGEARLSLPAPLPGRGRGTLSLVVSAEGSGATARERVTLRYAYAVAAAVGPALLDGRLADWRDGTWHAVGLPDQVVGGAAAWTGEQDASLRWAARCGETGLDLALLVTDDDPTPGDRLTLLLDPRREALGQPGEVRGYDLPLGGAAGLDGMIAATGQVGSQRLLEARLPWELVGRRPESGELLGFDLELLDDSPAGPTRLTYTGEDWGRLDPAQLGLLRVGAGEPLVRLLIEP